MANVNITGLPNLTTLTDSSLLPTDSSGTTYHVSGSTLKTYVNSTTGNITAGNVNATGNVTGSYIIGNGSQLTGLPASYGNSDVAAYLPTYTGTLAGAKELIGSNTAANFTRFPNALAVVSNVAVGIQQNELGPTGLIAEATGNPANTTYRGVGLYGVGYTSGAASADGVSGEAHVSSSADTGTATAVRGYADSTHSGINIGLYSSALGGDTNYALYMKHGNILSFDQQSWTVVANTANALTIGSATNANLLVVNTAANVVDMSGDLSATGNVYGNVFIGNGAGLTNVTSIVSYGNAIALGPLAAANAAGGISIGYTAGNTAQQANTIAIGQFAGQVSQVTQAIAIGLQAGQSAQGQRGIAIGRTAASTSQGNWAVAIGYTAGNLSQGQYAVGIGAYAGNTNQGSGAIAMGWNAATYSQGSQSVALGYLAGQCFQGTTAVAVGYLAGLDQQGNNAVAIGVNAGEFSQGATAVAVGINAGLTNQGANSVAIGAFAGYAAQANNSIILNGTGAQFSGNVANALYIKPVRNVTSTNAWTNPANTLPTGFFFTAYNPTTGELIYWS